MDATFIQRVHAKLYEFLEKDDLRGRCIYGEPLWYVSDYDRDGERTIMDATAIQRKIAKLEDSDIVATPDQV